MIKDRPEKERRRHNGFVVCSVTLLQQVIQPAQLVPRHVAGLKGKGYNEYYMWLKSSTIFLIMEAYDISKLERLI